MRIEGYLDDNEMRSRMTLVRAEALERARYSVKAVLDGFPTPEEFGDYIPDIYATKRGEATITAVETCQSFFSEFTRVKFEVFSTVPDTLFHIKVPRSCFMAAQRKIREWGIRVDWWWADPRY